MTRRTFLALVAATLLTFALPAFPAESTPIRVACVGDSITFGAGIHDPQHNSYPAQLGAKLGEAWSVKNFGVNGATLLKNGDKPYWNQTAYNDALAFAPNIVVIMLGTNDTKPQNWKHKDQFLADYLALIESFRNLDSKPTVWVCYPVPAYPGRWGISDTLIKNELCPQISEIAKKADVKIIDLYSALSDKKELFPDTVHPNAEGAKLMMQTIASHIAPNPQPRH